MTEPVKRRGRPKGSKNTKPAKPRFTRKVPPETPPVSAYGASPAQVDEMVEDLAGNGRDETAYEPEPPPTPFQEAVRRQKAEAPDAPQLAKLFVAAVENGYVIRPAYSNAYKGAADDRSWVVTSREELARMVSWLVAERGKASPDMLGGPLHMPQPEAHYAPPIMMHADETVGE